ncbi:MAG: hypothetical protein ACPGUV_08575 [Polyangiales bacterium]
MQYWHSATNRTTAKQVLGRLGLAQLTQIDYDAVRTSAGIDPAAWTNTLRPNRSNDAMRDVAALQLIMVSLLSYTAAPGSQDNTDDTRRANAAAVLRDILYWSTLAPSKSARMTRDPTRAAECTADAGRPLSPYAYLRRCFIRGQQRGQVPPDFLPALAGSDGAPGCGGEATDIDIWHDPQVVQALCLRRGESWLDVETESTLSEGADGCIYHEVSGSQRWVLHPNKALLSKRRMLGWWYGRKLDGQDGECARRAHSWQVNAQTPWDDPRRRLFLPDPHGGVSCAYPEELREWVE